MKTYNDLNQLTNQTITVNNITYECLYFYDENSNLIANGINKTKENGISVDENICFSEYAFNAQNEMTLQTIGSESITNLYQNIYQTLGRPNLYKGYEFGYNFDNLEYMENYKYRIIHTYNSQGIRTSKQVTNKEENKTTLTKYILEGNLIIKEIVTGDENYIVNYHYDNNNELVGFSYNNENYSYIKDLQGNINKIVDDEGNIMVEYYYSGYGILLNSIDNSNINLSNINPFRYRGYYQDNETLFYYLNARFYDSDSGRLITMDDISYLGASNTVHSYNLFTYCENNPIMYVDDSGNSFVSVLITIVCIIFVVAVVTFIIWFFVSEIINLILGNLHLSESDTEDAVDDLANITQPSKFSTAGSSGPPENGGSAGTIKISFADDDFFLQCLEFNSIK